LDQGKEIAALTAALSLTTPSAKDATKLDYAHSSHGSRSDGDRVRIIAWKAAMRSRASTSIGAPASIVATRRRQCGDRGQYIRRRDADPDCGRSDQANAAANLITGSAAAAMSAGFDGSEGEPLTYSAEADFTFTSTEQLHRRWLRQRDAPDYSQRRVGGLRKRHQPQGRRRLSSPTTGSTWEVWSRGPQTYDLEYTFVASAAGDVTAEHCLTALPSDPGAGVVIVVVRKAGAPTERTNEHFVAAYAALSDWLSAK
jgi:hypothetical protein